MDFRPYDHSAELLFNGSDFNHDGIFSRDELEQEFKKYDADGEWAGPFVLVLNHKKFGLKQIIPNMLEFILVVVTGVWYIPYIYVLLFH